MYCHHFGFEKSPFRITPDPELFFPGANRGAVLDALVYAVARGEGIVKVVGEVGSGKTMLCRMLERELPQDCEIVYLANPRLAPDEVPGAIAAELRLELPRGATKLEVMHGLHDHLLKRHADNRRVVVFIEEAQGMPLETLEEIRLLSNLETSQDKLLQIVMFGQPELDQKLAAHEIRQLKERITYTFRLEPFTTMEIRDYLLARIHASGYRGRELFSRAAIRELTRCSGGLVRRVNVLADKALLAAYAKGEGAVKTRHVRLAARDSEYVLPVVSRPVTALAACTLLAIGAFAAWYHGAAGNPGPHRALKDPAALGEQAPRPALPALGYGDLTEMSAALATSGDGPGLVADEGIAPPPAAFELGAGSRP